ncbi:hypothetical protein Z947_4024 [Sulfitobacter geojensis]|nr:hypothetical protein Z947_4024 [Sulfitobacter geojensis]
MGLCISHCDVFRSACSNPWRGGEPSERTRRDGTLRGGLAEAGWHAEATRRCAKGSQYVRRVSWRYL